MLYTRTVLRFQKSKLKGIQESHVGLLYKSFPFLYFKADWLQFINEDNNMGHESLFVAPFFFKTFLEYFKCLPWLSLSEGGSFI